MVKTVGVLALQGNFEEHGAVLDMLNLNKIFVRTLADLQAVDCLILPGGESTVMMKLLTESGLDEQIKQRVLSGMPVLGTCAGAVLLSDTHLNLLDISVDRNAYGSQVHSFIKAIHIGDDVIDVSFIRAPIITRVGPSVTVLASHQHHPVAVQQHHILASTFHTELTGDTILHTLLAHVRLNKV
ncbi:MAG: pyridoxal 5'-phosphate synthase glutaminase subunit PdxT [Candidatus Peregrinibacteria bacterium]|nr:pyridoxal 5'-phosphate synthase glutaminase subunit PdxT [Candidatus Peregrinibacteria bacterium]MCB9808260.1 pyridoxal 5'-phosphate synthase glutaminase subunit PdxT [Candidatus Peribacteria bacterium]